MIIFSGKDYRNIKNDKGLTFTMEGTSFSNITGSGCFGFSGALNKSFNFKFIKGGLYDSNSNLFYSYDKDEEFDFSGVVDQSLYFYYINGEAYRKSANRTNYKIQNFFVETSGTDLNTHLNIYSKEPRKLTVALPSKFDLSGVVTGTISNASSQYALDVFTGSVLNTDHFEMKSIEKTGHLTVSNSINFVLESKSGEFGDSYDLNLLFNTSAGDLEFARRTEAHALTPYDLSELTMVTDVFQSGENAALTYDSGSYLFNNEKTTLTGSGVVGDYYQVFLKYSSGYSGVNTGWAGGYSISSAGSGYADNFFSLVGSKGTGADGRILSNGTGDPEGLVTGLSIFNLGRNYSGFSPPQFNIKAIYGPTGEVLSSGSGLSITPIRVAYTKSFWNVWSISSGTSLTGLVPITGQVQNLPAYSGETTTNEDFYIGVQAKNYYDSMIQGADLIVSGVSNGKEFSRTVTGVA